MFTIIVAREAPSTDGLSVVLRVVLGVPSIVVGVGWVLLLALTVEGLCVWVRVLGRVRSLLCYRRCGAWAWRAWLEHCRVFDKGLRNAVARIIRGTVELVLREGVVVGNRMRVALLGALAASGRWLSTSLGALLGGLSGRGWETAAVSLLLSGGQSFQLVISVIKSSGSRI